MERNNLKQKVEEISSVDFSVVNCPLKVWQDFKEYCRLNTQKSYAMGLKDLLNVVRDNSRDAMFFERIDGLQAEIDELRVLVDGKEVASKPKIPTFGGKKNE